MEKQKRDEQHMVVSKTEEEMGRGRGKRVAAVEGRGGRGRRKRKDHNWTMPWGEEKGVAFTTPTVRNSTIIRDGPI